MVPLAVAQAGGSNNTWLLVFGTIIAAAVAGFFGWKGIKALNSGTIKNSTAADLWTESNAMRQELRDRLVAAEKKAADMESAVELARQEANLARQEAITWQQKAMEMERKTATMEKQIATLQRQVLELRKK